MRLFWIFLALTTILRAGYAAFLPLTGDEAYFWEWGRHPALSYYDHPPMAGWILSLINPVLGNTTLSVRLPAVLTGTVIIYLIYRLTLDITRSHSTAARVGLLAMGIPFIEVSGLLYSTDTPLLLGATLGGYMFYRATAMYDDGAWVWVGISFSLVMLSKFLGVAIIAACASYLVISSKHRRCLKTSGPYLASGLIILGFVPVLIWNAQNGWATFVFNFSSRHAPLSLGISNSLDYFVGQLFSLSPLVLFFLIPAIFSGFPALRGNFPENPWQIPSFLALVPLGGFLFLSLFSKVGLHWPGVGVPFAVVAAGVYLLKDGPGYRGRFTTTLSLAWLITILLFAITLIPWLVPGDWKYPLRPEKINAAQLKKYMISPEEAGKSITEAIDQLPKFNEHFVFTKSYALSSLVGFYTPAHPEVTVLGKGSAHGRNHLLWFEPSDHIGENAVFVTYRNFDWEQPFLNERFERVELGKDLGNLTIIKCYGFKGIQ